MNKLYIDCHILQTVPPSNMNRDDSGTPKHAIYGGARRARVSSQAWKRAVRRYFEETVPEDQRGVRTKQLGRLLTASLNAATTDLEPEALERLAGALQASLGISESATSKRAGDIAYLLFFGRRQLDKIANLVAPRAKELADLDDKQLAEELKALNARNEFGTGHPIDVALFGRMVANIPDLNVDAAVQVAHALSTHAVQVEFDYFTAVDDENTRGETGAGMIGRVEFNSATLYRYATLAVHLLAENLEDDSAVTTAATAFVDGFINSMPTGHANTFAHHTLPHLVALTFRTDRPVNLVSAFERPVTTIDHGLAAESAKRLAIEHQRATSTWSLKEADVTASYILDPTEELTAEFGLSRPARDLLREVESRTTAYLAGNTTQ